MAVKKAAPAKKKATAKKTVSAKKPIAKKPGKTSIKKGDKYQCAVCGMGITVDRTIGYIGLHEIICCGKAMKSKS